MATKMTVTETHVCDMCESEHPREALATVGGPGRNIDICPDCQSRPISDLLEVINQTATQW